VKKMKNEKNSLSQTLFFSLCSFSLPSFFRFSIEEGEGNGSSELVSQSRLRETETYRKSDRKE
jgi:hypothetical protein